MSESLAFTARWAAAQRARESQRPDRLFDDPLAQVLAGPEGAEMLRLSEAHNPRSKQVADYLIVRTRFFDDFLVGLTDHERGQVVMVAAGMDTRAFRLDLPADTTLYELDQPTVLDLKEQLLRKSVTEPLVRRVPVAVDLQGDWITALQQAGFEEARPSVWIVEGLLYYLEEPHVRQLLQSISQCAARRSCFGADLVSASFFRSPWTQPALESMKARGMAWHWGTDDPEQFFGEFGWQAQAVQPGEGNANYGRWSEPVFPREQRELPRSFFVTARKA